MIEQLETLSYWHWIILGLLLLAGEALGAAGFLIGLAISAFMIGALLAVDLVHDWQIQFLLFALFSVLASIVFWKFFRSQNTTDEAVNINNRAAQLIGRKLTLQADVDNGQGKIQIGDTLWKVEAEGDLKTGTLIEVYASEGMVLHIRAV
ncbi:NfeD family protein [Neptuniibacter sp. 1_MG-2023]|uniref:NfeD family protein n=1 Tax=Neptuniibacter sp. 1_MG-2023 TaxID=3062662 RepID=UPI0026E473B5|nr:NfeD family protein [Neptuniibacter sp. 1_MG-2023]MDO6594878.1 NfeD family protein [Neptuniibacter sp. 1_MG-2023]